LALEIGSAYMQVARLQGVPGNPNLGQFAQARESLSKGDAFVESVLAARAFAERRKALLVSAQIAQDGMILADTENRREEALVLARKSAERLDALYGITGLMPEEVSIVTRVYANIALFHSNAHLMEEAARYARRSVEISRRYGND